MANDFGGGILRGQATCTTTSNVELIAAQTGTIKTRITDISITNDGATNTHVIIKDGTTEVFRYAAPANGGAIHPLSTPIEGTAATAINVALADALTSGESVIVSATGYQHQP